MVSQSRIFVSSTPTQSSLKMPDGSSSSLFLSLPGSSVSPLSSSPRITHALHQNGVNPSSRWLVQKYGGTTVGKLAVKIASEVISNHISEHKVAIVCSSWSELSMELGPTDFLPHATSETLRHTKHTRGGRETTSFYDMADLIRREYIATAKTFIRDTVVLEEVEAEINEDCDWFRGSLCEGQVGGSDHLAVDESSQVNINSLSEQLSCRVMVAILKDQGIDAQYLAPEDIILDIEYIHGTAGERPDQAFYDQLSVALRECVDKCGSRVPVLTASFDPAIRSLLRKAGRDHGDLLSTLLAVGLQASELQIWKDVDGIFTADPQRVSTARLIPVIFPEEVAELAYYGSGVVHPFTMEQAIRRNIPIRIKNIENPNGGGTVIHPDPDPHTLWMQQDCNTGSVPEQMSSIALQRTFSPAEKHWSGRLPTAVVIKEHIIVINVNSNHKTVSHGFLTGIFGTLDRFGIVADLISTSEVHVSLAIQAILAMRFLDGLVEELKNSGTVSVHPEMAIISLVGKQMRNMVGIAGRMFTALAQRNVNIEMMSQGASEINISCVIEGRHAIKALNLIHHSCLQSQLDNTMGRAGSWML